MEGRHSLTGRVQDDVSFLMSIRLLNVSATTVHSNINNFDIAVGILREAKFLNGKKVPVI